MTLPRELHIRCAAIGQLSREWPEPVDSWLGLVERQELQRLRDGNRRQQWLAGRWLSKQLIGQLTDDAAGWSDLQILSRDDQGRGARPRIFIDSRELDWTLSISHTDRSVAVAVAATNHFTVGIDIVGRVPSSDGFSRLWFTPAERRWLNDDTDRRPQILWALKEAVYKAAHCGEEWDPRQVEVLPRASNHVDCSYRGELLCTVVVELRELDDQVLAIVCLPAACGVPSDEQNHNFSEMHHD